MHKKKKILWTSLFLLGISFLTFTERWGYKPELLEPDSVYMLRLAKKFLGMEQLEIPRTSPSHIDILSYYPSPRDLRFEETFLPRIGAQFFRIATWLGPSKTDLNLEKFLYSLSFIFVALNAVAAFFLLKILFRPAIAFLSSILYAISPAVMVKTWPGTFDKECLAGLVSHLLLLCFIQAYKNPLGSIRGLIWTLLAGIFLSVFKLTWGGYQFYVAILAMSISSFIVVSLLSKDSKDTCKCLGVSFLLSYLTGSLMAWFISPLASPLIEANHFILAAVCLCFFMTGISFLKSPVTGKRLVHILLSLIGLATLLLFALFLTNQSELIYAVKDFLIPGDPTALSVEEFRAGTFAILKNYFGSMVYFLPLCWLIWIYRGLRYRHYPSLFMFIWLSAGLAAFFFRIRFTFMLALVIPASAVSLIGILWKTIDQNPVKKNSLMNIKILVPFLAGILIFGLFLAEHAYSSLKLPRKAREHLNWTEPWRQACEWLKNNTPADAIVLSYWDYGYHIQNFGERRTIVDPGNREAKRNVDMARVLCSPEKDFTGLLRDYKLNNHLLYFMVSDHEIWTAPGINAHARDHLSFNILKITYGSSYEQDQKVLEEIIKKKKIRTYLQLDQGSSYLLISLHEEDETGMPHPEWHDKLLIRLLDFTSTTPQIPLKYFKLVHSNPHVRIYQYSPEGQSNE